MDAYGADARPTFTQEVEEISHARQGEFDQATRGLPGRIIAEEI